MLNWDDLRYMLSVVDHGSTLAAGNALNVSQTTVARRISALEENLGVALFHRQQSGYRPTTLCLALLEPTLIIAEQVNSIGAITHSFKRQLSKTVRITAPELYGVTVLPRILQALHLAYPDIQVELDMSDEQRNLTTGAADIALRIGKRPSDRDLNLRHIAYDRWAVYCSIGYSREHGIPASIADMKGRPFIGGGSPIIWKIYSDWLETTGLQDAISIHFNNILSLLAAIQSGAGLSVLPTMIAENLPDLIQCLPPSKDAKPIWIVTHERSQEDTAVHTVSHFLIEHLSRLSGG